MKEPTMQELNTLPERVDALEKEMGELRDILAEISAKLDKLDKLDSIDKGVQGVRSDIQRLRDSTKGGFEGVHTALGTWDREGIPPAKD